MMLIVSLWLKDENIAGFEAFERQAAAIMANHGGRIERVIRLDPPDQNIEQIVTQNPDTPFEVHWVSFPSEQAFANYRADPAVGALAALRTTVVARTQIWAGQEIDAYSP